MTQKRFHSLVKPYLASCLLFFLLKSIKDFKLGDISLFIGGVLYGTGESLSWPYQQLWFLMSLFVSVLACRVLYSVFKRVESVWFRSFFLCTLLAGGVLFIKQICPPLNGGLPWNIDLLGITVFFYALGFEMRQWLFRFKGVPALYFLVALLIFVCLHYYFTISLTDPHAINLYLRKYDHFLVNSLEAVSGILLVIFLSIEVEKRSLIISRFFSYIGRRSLAVFVFHELFMPYIGNTGKIFFRKDGFLLFVLSVMLTVGMTLMVHELVTRVPVIRFLLLNERAKG